MKLNAIPRESALEQEAHDKPCSRTSPGGLLATTASSRLSPGGLLSYKHASFERFLFELAGFQSNESRRTSRHGQRLNTVDRI